MSAVRLDWFCTRCRLRHREALSPTGQSRACRECAAKNQLTGAGLITTAGGDCTVRQCAACGAPDLWDRRDFPQRLGWALVALGGGGAILFWATGHPFYAIGLFTIFALFDAAAHWFTPPVTVCYNCMGEMRGVTPDHGGFDLHRAEEYAHSLEGLSDDCAGRSDADPRKNQTSNPGEP